MPASIRRCQPLLGTFVEITLRGECGENALLALGTAAFAEIRRIEALLSFHRADSELNRINRHAAEAPQRVSDDLRDVLAEALWLSELSGGLFDVSVAPHLVARGALPDHGLHASSDGGWRDIKLRGNEVRFARPRVLDLGGIAKGYAVDRALAQVPADIDACINAGGDLRMRPWHDRQAAIRLPEPSADRAVTLPMRASALATSLGIACDHLGLIIDPRDGEAAKDARSFSVFASSAMRADGLTKVACLAPDVGALMRAAGAQAIAVDARGRVEELDGRPTAAQGLPA